MIRYDRRGADIVAQSPRFGRLGAVISRVGGEQILRRPAAARDQGSGAFRECPFVS